MQKRNIQILSIGLLFLLFLMQSPQSGAASASAYNAATIVVTAGSDALVVGTPIIIAGSDFSGDFALATAVVMDGATALPTQYDAGLDELVFQLPAALAASGSKTFEVQADATGSSNGQTSITMTRGDYNETYSDFLPAWSSAYIMNGSALANDVHSIGDVIWVDTDWGVLCLQVEASWRHGTWKHVIMKDNNWDVVSGFLNATSDWRWRWETGLFQDADEGWQVGGRGPDTIEIESAGPVRAVIRAVANSPHRDLDQYLVENANATRTYTVYNGIPGITQHFAITGPNATQAHTDWSVLSEVLEPLKMKHQHLDSTSNTLGSNNLTKVYVAGDPTPSNETYTRNAVANLTAVTDSYFAVYNDTDTRGYVYNWGPFEYLDNITNLEFANQIVMNYRFDYFPAAGFNRYWIPFSSFTGNIGDHAASLNTNMKSLMEASYTFVITEHDPPTTTTTTTTTEDGGAPGFELVLATLSLVGASVFIRKRR